MTHPLLVDVPEEIETDRLTIRMPRPGDGPAVNAAIVESHADLRPWLAWAVSLPAVAEAHARRANARFRLREDLSYRAWLKGTDTFVVGSGLHRIDWSVPRFEIGYWCRTSFAGRGYVGEVVRALTATALDRLGARRVEIRVDDRNERSWRVAERCGFTHEGTLRRYAVAADGSLEDVRVYAVTNG